MSDLECPKCGGGAVAPYACCCPVNKDREALQHMLDCWQAAEVEGLHAAVSQCASEHESVAANRLSDLITRRIAHGVVSLQAVTEARESIADFEIRVDGMKVAGASGPRARALEEAMHYLPQYAEEGDVVELVEITLIQTHEAKHD